MDKKTRDLATVVKMEPPDLKRLQLLLAGSISTQVNQGIQEYAAFFKDTAHLPAEHVEQLRQAYRSEGRGDSSLSLSLSLSLPFWCKTYIILPVDTLTLTF